MIQTNTTKQHLEMKNTLSFERAHHLEIYLLRYNAQYRQIHKLIQTSGNSSIGIDYLSYFGGKHCFN